MGKRKSSYNALWEEEFPWLKKVSTDPFLACCVVCSKNFRIDGAGISQVQSHSTGLKHIDNEKKTQGQRTLLQSPTENCIVVSAARDTLSPVEQVTKAEALQALKCVDSNLSFASANGDGDRFRQMFPDSKIAEQYRQSETKMKYTIQYGLCPYFKDLLQRDFRAKAFSFKFDETTTSQIKKQYDGYVQYWSNSFNRIVIAYCGSLFVDHCPSEKLVEHFYEFIEKTGLDVNYMLHLGMDGPNVNLKFQTLLLQSLETTIFLNIGTCPLHIVHNALRKGVVSLKFDVDQFALDINFFFKLSAARRADYKDMSSVTDIAAEYALKHSTTRWVTLRKVIVRLIEQFENLKEYFLSFLPTTSSFKSSVKNTPRYVRICDVLRSKETLPYLSFIVYFATDFESFLTKFQSMKQMVYLLYEEMEQLLWNLMAKFLKSKHIMEENNGKNQAVSASHLLLIDVTDPKVPKPLKMIDIGTKAKDFFQCSTLEMDDDKKRFVKDCLNCYQKTVQQLQAKLPFNSFLKNCSYINPLKRHHSGSLGKISDVAATISNVLANVLKKVFPQGVTIVDEISDAVRTEWRLYQTECIPESSYLCADSTTTKKSSSYWEKAFEVAGITSSAITVRSVDIEMYTTYLQNIVGLDGKPKYPFLCCLFKLVLSLSHGNSAPEDGFSINKPLLGIHGYALEEDTIESLRLVKDSILRYTSLLDIPITKEMLRSMKSARQRYVADLEEKKRQKEKEDAVNKEEKEKGDSDERSAELNHIDLAISQIKNGVNIAEENVKEGSNELKELLTRTNATRNDLQRAQSKIEMGMKRKSELNENEEVLLKRRKGLKKEIKM